MHSSIEYYPVKETIIDPFHYVVDLLQLFGIVLLEWDGLDAHSLILEQLLHNELAIDHTCAGQNLTFNACQT